MHDNNVRKSDVWMGLFWVGLGLAIIIHASGMPIPRNLGATTMTGPGFLPMLLGGGLALLGGVLALRALREAPPRPGPVAEEQVSNGRAVLSLVYMVFYAALLATRQPFVPITIVFIALFVVTFNWREGRGTAARLRLLAGALVLAAATAFLIEFVFEQIFFVRLP